MPIKNSARLNIKRHFTNIQIGYVSKAGSKIHCTTCKSQSFQLLKNRFTNGQYADVGRVTRHIVERNGAELLPQRRLKTVTQTPKNG
jgi:hypothetical protein